MAHSIDLRVATNGRLVLPKAVREALGVVHGGALVASIDGDVVTLTPIRQSIARAQALYRAYATHDLPVADFIAERRAEAARDDRD